MLRIFRIIDPFRLLYIALLVLVFKIFLWFFISNEILDFELKWILLGEWLTKGNNMYTQTYDFTAPFTAWSYKFLVNLFGRNTIAFFILNATIIFIQGIIFNQIALRFKIFHEKGYLPAFIYVLVTLTIPLNTTFSPQLISLTFILLAVHHLIKKISNQEKEETVLISGLYMGVASCFFSSALFFVLIFAVCLLLFSSVSFSKFLQFFVGFFFVHGILIIYYLINNNFNDYFISFYIRGFGFHLIQSPFTGIDIIYSVGFISLILLLSIWKTLSYRKFTNFQQSIQAVFVLMLLGTAACLLFSSEKIGLELVFIAPALSFFLTNWILLLKSKFLNFILTALILIGFLTNGFYANSFLKSKLKPNFSQKTPQKAMIIGDFTAYHLQEINSPSFDNYLTKRALENLSDENIIKMYMLFDKTKPSYIEDKLGLIDNLFYKLPIIKNKYEQIEKGKYQRINN